jgi:hypothetical protein
MRPAARLCLKDDGRFVGRNGGNCPQRAAPVVNCRSQKVAGKGNATWNNIIKVSVAVLPAEVPFAPPRSNYDEVHKAYVKVGNARVLRERPCFHKGWEAEFEVAANAGDIDEKNLRKFVEKAGMRGIGDHRPEKGGSYGTFKVISFERIEA